MIRKTLNSVREATFCINLPSQARHGMPAPTGTGFFISPDGWFVTAAHVITKNGGSNGEPRDDINKAWLVTEDTSRGAGSVSLGHVIPKFDIALLKVDFDINSNNEWLIGRKDFPYINVSSRDLEMGEPVYSFGYPLSESSTQDHGGVIFGQFSLSPRVTSAVVSSNIEKTQMLKLKSDPKLYVLDKALNYGNSGGPIIAAETGKVHALCSRFQPVSIHQPHIKDGTGKPVSIVIPSLYGVVSSLNNQTIIDLFKQLGVPISDE